MPFTFTVKQNPLEISFEAGSPAEGAAILAAEDTALRAAFVTAAALANDDSGTTGPVTGQPTAAETVADTNKRTRRTKAQIAADEAAAKAAVAPAPLPVPLPAPNAPPVAPIPPGDPNGDVPAFLARTAPPAPAAVMAPPPAPPPPAPPAPPAVGSVLGQKVIATLKEKKGATDGAAYARWLSDSKVVASGATFDEAMAVLEFFTEDQMKPLAKALGI